MKDPRPRAQVGSTSRREEGMTEKAKRGVQLTPPSSESPEGRLLAMYARLTMFTLGPGERARAAELADAFAP